MRVSNQALVYVIGASSLALAPGANAQAVSSEAPEGSGSQTLEAGADQDQSEIVVTGSRVIQNGNNSPTPLTILSQEQLLKAAPTNVPDALSKLPMFSSVPGQNNFNNATRNFSGNYLALRGLGPARTLVLFDGRRTSPSTQDGLVDANTLPQLLLKRVDVVTGGVSAVYGSDAVAGVVNFVVDNDFNGLKVLAQTGISDRGDNGSYRLGIAGGTEIMGGRGHIEGSLEFYDSPGIPTKLGRKYGRQVWSTQGQGTAANPFRLVQNTRLSQSSDVGLIRSGPFADMVFGGPGNALRPFAHGTPTGTIGVESGGDGIFFNSSLQASLQTAQAFARFDYELSGDLDFFVEASATQSKNRYTKEENGVRNITLSSQNAFLPASIRQAMADAGASTFVFSRSFVEAPNLTPSARVRSYFVLGGLKGSLGDGVDWDISYSHSEARQKVSTLYHANLGRLYASLDAVFDPAGNIVCNVSLTHPGLYPGCVPLNPFGAGTITQEMQDYILGRTTFNLRNRMDDIGASITASPFSTWAGPVRVALSGAYRHLTTNVTSDATPTERTPCIGLRFNCTPNTPLFAAGVSGEVRGAKQNVSEGALEVDIPLLADTAIAEELNLNGALRYTHYNTSGDVTTWKVGARWVLNSDLSFRGTYSRDIRAPNLNDLFSPINIAPMAGISDLHTGRTLQVPLQSQGNPDLDPEIANTLTAGAVWRPSWFPHFSLSIDAFRIKLDNVIVSISANDPLTQAECERSNGTSPYCALIERPLPFSDRSAANVPTRIFAQPVNAAKREVRGIDLELNYVRDIFAGQAYVRALGTYVDRDVTTTFPGAPAIDAAGSAGTPKYKVAAFVGYRQGPFSVDVVNRWHSSTRLLADRRVVVDAPKLPAAIFTDATFELKIKSGRTEPSLFVNVQNLFDKQPTPFVPPGGASSVPGFFVPVSNAEDPIGRSFNVGFRMNL